MKKYMWKRVAAGLLVVACLLPTSALAVRTTDDETPAIPAGEEVAAFPLELPAGAYEVPQAALLAADLSTGLAGYWTFDGADDTARLTNHAADSAITASLAGSATIREDGGIDGSSVYFDETASSPLKLNLTEAGQGLNAASTDFTLAAWINYDSDMDTARRVDLFQLTGGGRTILYVNPNGTYGTFLTASDVVMSTTAPVGGRWHHVVLTWDHTTNTMTCYINGRQEVSETLTGSPADSTTDIWIGAHKADAGQEIKGHVDELRYYTRALSQEDVTALYTYNGYNEIAEVAAELHVTVDPDTVVRDITPAMFGINHRYHKNGYGTWDTTATAVNETFNAMVQEAGFGSVRWPGGTVSNLFTWKDSIGPLAERTPTIAGNNFYSDGGEAPVEPGFGLDEAAKWICDDLGVEMIYVYGMGRGSAQDAADLVEYLNAPNDGSNPGGGTDWAAVRAENGHPDPYNVTKFEIGNEFTDVGQNYWATPRYSNADQAVEDYIEGGVKAFAGETQNQHYQHNDRVVKKGDWRKAASFSDGLPNEERYLCYVPVIEGTATVYVNGEQWQIVDTLAGQGAANVCTLDYETGKITFGDGTNGNIPPAGQQITAHYSSDRDGFAAYSDAMKAIANEIDGLEIKIYSGVHDALQSSFITKMHQKGYDAKYDGVIYHPYAGQYSEATYDEALTKARAFAATIGTLKTQMDNTSGYTNKEVAVSEFGINAAGNFTKSLGNAIYTANHMIDCVNQGAAYQNRHCLVDFTVGDNLGNWEQSVIQCLGSASSAVSGNNYIVTPSAHVFSIFNYMTGNTQVGYTATGNDNYASGNGQTVQKVNLYTTKDDDGNVYALVVNNQKSDAQKLHLALNGEDLTGREIEVWSLTSDSVMDQNTQSEPNKVTVQKTKTTVEGETLTYTLPAHSITSFKLSSASVPVDKTELAAAVADAEKVEKGNYTDASWTVFQTAIAEAKAVLDNGEATQEEVDEALAALDTAKSALAKKPSTPDDPVTPDKPTKPSTPSTPVTPTEPLLREDGAKVTTTVKPNGDKVETVEQTDGVKSETVTARNGDKTITVTDPEGEELVKAELPATIPTPDTEFDDIDQTPWAVEAIHNMTALGLVNGVGSGLYDTSSPITRGALATVLHRLSNGKTDYEVVFKDVLANKYYTQSVAWAAKAKVVTGYTADIFAPDDIITREQLAVMMARYAKLIGMDTTAKAESLDNFVDGDSTGAWAVDGVAWCVEKGILKGKGQNGLDPTANVSRAEVAVMLDRFINLIQK